MPLNLSDYVYHPKLRWAARRHERSAVRRSNLGQRRVPTNRQRPAAYHAMPLSLCYSDSGGSFGGQHAARGTLTWRCRPRSQLRALRGLVPFPASPLSILRLERSEPRRSASLSGTAILAPRLRATMPRPAALYLLLLAFAAVCRAAQPDEAPPEEPEWEPSCRAAVDQQISEMQQLDQQQASGLRWQAEGCQAFHAAIVGHGRPLPPHGRRLAA